MNHYSAQKEGVGEISLPAAEGTFFQRTTLWATMGSKRKIVDLPYSAA